jgi:hypothetical protein
MKALQVLIEQLTRQPEGEQRNKMLADSFLRLGKWRREHTEVFDEVKDAVFLLPRRCDNSLLLLCSLLFLRF